MLIDSWKPETPDKSRYRVSACIEDRVLVAASYFTEQQRLLQTDTRGLVDNSDHSPVHPLPVDSHVSHHRYWTVAQPGLWSG
ncbi:hypothetical protein RRG08_067028 [Elysia crispata]|uniref:Uncharacterized protein n=1 Tax=Elysia crispata TaxID=231223 RepID=A0AAE0ZZG4_9GAST|nr:hypothetical protein RRG08_067028 [Elysia crispata]